MPKTFFFYDLETSGLNSRHDRIMQFAGRRTDMDFNPIGESLNVLVRMSDDTLPSPDALMVTGITPQQTLSDGLSEVDFTKLLMNEVFVPDTIITGYNNIRFDDEFIRHLMWRSFYDAYEWSYGSGCSRWDLLDVVRMTRALRPDGIKWPVDEKGQATNRLELISSINGIDHHKAHDAMSDVDALVSVAKIIKQKQPQLFEYLLKLRDKNEVKKLVNLDDKQPFVYSSGRFDTKYNKTTVAWPLTTGRNKNIIVYDLRYDPSRFLKMSQKQLSEVFFASSEQRKSDDFEKLPVKEMYYNRAPAVAPIGVLFQEDGWKKIGLNEKTVQVNLKKILAAPEFAENVRSLFEGREEFKKSSDVDEQLYDSFVPEIDRMRLEAVRSSDANKLADFHPNFTDERLEPLLLHYKARNYPTSLAEDEIKAWEEYRSRRLAQDLPQYVRALQRLASQVTDENKHFVLQELQLWAESVVPSDY